MGTVFRFRRTASDDEKGYLKPGHRQEQQAGNSTITAADSGICDSINWFSSDVDHLLINDLYKFFILLGSFWAIRVATGKIGDAKTLEDWYRFFVVFVGHKINPQINCFLLQANGINCCLSGSDS